MTIDMSEWKNEDWGNCVQQIEAWLIAKFENVDDIWPNRREFLYFDNNADAIEFIMRWAWNSNVSI